jgi:uncharacterized membrane protein
MSDVERISGWRLAPGWMKMLLIVSLSANVAVIGLIGGNAIRHWQQETDSGKLQNEPGLDRRQTRILRMVPEVRQDEARVILLGRQGEYQTARETMLTANMALADSIRQEPLDHERVTAALAERRAASSQMWGIGYEQIVEIARGLDASDRAELANRLEERTKRWMERQARKAK